LNRISHLSFGLLIVSLLAPPPAAADWAADEAEIRRGLADSTAAFNRGNDPGVTFMTKDGPRAGIAPIERAFRESYFRDGQAIQALRFDDLAVRPLAPDVALATARWTLSCGGKTEASGWFTLVFKRTAAGWRAVHDHSS
jgi:ketosteroid isomerase-like protein